PGAVQTYSIEGMMQDRKALQAGTSHYLGQNFSKAAGIKFLDENGELQFAHTTSWGMSTRMIGGLIMTHGDDDGLRVPPKVAPHQVAILPVIPKDEERARVLEYAESLKKAIVDQYYGEERVRVTLDKRDIRGGEKTWQWVKRGVPIRLEVGPRDIDENKVVLYRRDKEVKDKEFLSRDEAINRIPEILASIQQSLFEQARSYRDANIVTSIRTMDELRDFFTPQNNAKPEIHGGFVRAPWCEDPETEAQLAEWKLSIRNIPFDQGDGGNCVVTGKPAKREAIIAKSY
ncbi:MAG: proline--tRNA ligase, partial [Bdellovibrionales bacterium]|nr:proline--tRNA ligase [Bdellovibrionales bacterium]